MNEFQALNIDLLKLKKILLNKSVLIYLLIILLFNIALINFPLTNVFGYEFSVLNSVLLVLLSGIFCLNILKKDKTLLYVSKRRVLTNLIVTYLLFLIMPLIVSLINSLFTITCSLSDGFFFYLIVTFPSVIIGSSLGILCFSIFKRFKVLFFVLTLSLILLIPLFEFYFNPQVYFYNPIFAYLPGTIYDEGLRVDFTLILYRIFNIIYFGGIFILSLKWLFDEVKFSRKVLFTIVILIPVLFIYFAPRLNFATDLTRIKSELKGKIETEHFKIYYSEKIDKKLIKDIALHHEYYYEELSIFFEVDLKRKITSFLFLNREQKKRLFGSGNADVAKPWLYQIFTVYDNYLTTLKHEIAHCFTAAFAEGIFKAADNFNPALIEGIAVAADPIYDENKIDYMAALAFHNGYKIDMNNLYSFSSFFTNVSSLSYIYAGAFSKFLIKEYGIEKFKDLYNDLDFNMAYGVSLDSLSKEFYSALDLIKNKGKTAEANYYFGRVSIFYKVCPRFAASQLKEGWNYFYKEEYFKSKKVFENLLKVTNNYSALIGLAKSKAKSNDYLSAFNLLKKDLNSFKNSSYYYGIMLTAADILAMQGNSAAAEQYYKKIIEQNPNRTYYYISQVRLNLLKKDTLITLYLKGNEFDKFIILKKLNLNDYNYYSFPVLIDLAKVNNIEFEIFIKQFDKTISVTDYSSSYAVYKLSNYMLENLDFSDARKMAALSLRYNADKNFAFILKNNYEKTDWFFYNAQDILNQIKIN